jgi:hypothetical protein
MTRVRIFALLCALVSSFALAVPDNAVDFTVKDVGGKSHTLFSYLNAGKYVLLEFAQNSAS